MSQLHDELERQRLLLSQGIITPPLERLHMRSRRRRQRATMAAVAGAVSLVAAAVAFVPGAPSPASDVARGTTTTEATRYKVSLAVPPEVEPDARRGAMDACLENSDVDVERQGPDEFIVTARSADAVRGFEACARALGLYRVHLASRPPSGSLSTREMERLAAKITADGEALAAEGIDLIHWGPDDRRSLVVVGVSGALARADAALHERYGDAVLVVLSEPGSRF